MPPNEVDRLRALASYEILDTAPENTFDRITRLAARLTGMPIALVSLVDRDREWFKSRYGMEASEIDRGCSFSAYTLETQGLTVVPDALADPRFSDNPWVVGPPGIRFYAGAPLVDRTGYSLGALTVMDTRPHPEGLDEHQSNLLADLAAIVVEHIEARLIRKAERALHEAEARYRLVTRATNDVLWDWDLETNQIQWNESLTLRFGYELASLDTSVEFWKERIHPSDRARVLEGLYAAINGASDSWEDEYRFRHAPGHYAHVLDRGYLLRDERGRAVRMVGTMIDLTERRRVEMQVRRNQEELNHAQKLAGIGSWSYLIDDGKLTWSDQVFEIFGIARDEFGGRLVDFISRVHPDDRFMMLARQNEILARGGNFENEYRIVRPDGTVRIVHERGELTVDEETHRPLLLGTVQDVTDRRQVEQALRESENRYRLLFEANPQPMWVFDEETLRFLAVNPAAVQTYGYSQDEFATMTILDIRPPEDRPRLLEHLRSPDAHRDKNVLWRHIRKDGSVRYVEVRGHRLTFGGRPARLILATDVTDRRLLEEQLRHAQKMEAVGQLAGGIAHDFNNLLTVINGYARLLAARPEATPLQHELNQIINAGDRAAALTQQLLAFGRKQVLQPRVLVLNDVVSAMASMIRRLFPANIRVDLNLSPDLREVRVDSVQIEQVILNLAINAKDAMPEGGVLTIETRNLYLDEQYAALKEGIRPGWYVMMGISDTGIGISPEHLPRIFEPFFTTKEKGKGTGLGLPTAYGIVRQSGGQIFVYSELGQGTTFKIYFPEHASGEDQTAEPAKDIRELTGSETILLVEDDHEVRQFAATVLKSRGYRVLEAADAANALQIAHRHEGPIDLLVTDVVMPGMNGPKLASELTRLRPGLRVLYISGYAENAVAHHGVLDAGIEYLAKPFSPTELAHKVREVIENMPRLITILVVDDEPGVRAFLRQVLEPEGYRVFEAADGGEALDCCRREQVDLILMDLVMPDKEGLETIQELRRSFPQIRVIAMSGAPGGAIYLEAARHLGADNILAKPIDVPNLLQLVRRLAG
jgi:PAS domain S-box-containing protein